MKNITEIIKKVISDKINWKHSIFYLVINLLKENNFEISFWDNEENWASIIEGEETKGYIWQKYPLIICEKNTLPKVLNLFKDLESIYYIEVNSLTKDLFKIDDEELYKYFDDDFKFESFTMEDLWFYTNSI